MFIVTLLLATAGSDAAFIILDNTAINLSCTLLHSAVAFLDGARNYCHSRSRCINVVCICDSTAGRGAAILTLIMMVPIDSSRQELSNGCHIVILSKFDILVETAAAALIWSRLATF